MSFSSLGLSAPLLHAVGEKGYSVPTPVQLKAIPAVLNGNDVMAAAQTGTGKTAGFTLPLLQRLACHTNSVRSNHIRTLVLVPTRELAVQVGESIAAYGKYLPLRSAVVYGGVKINPQMMQLRAGLDILVATPGRLLDLFQHNAVKFSQVEVLVLDEADKMLDLGFSDDIAKILSLLPKRRQNLLFSATFSDDIRRLADNLLYKPIQIETSPRNSAAGSVKQWVYEVDKSKKPELLCHLLQNNTWQQVLVFTRTKIGADQLVKKLASAGIPALAIHGDKSQGARTKALTDFKAKDIRVLVATDIASRGLDISELSHVINIDLPKIAEDYIHRIGRTGRAGLDGVAISLVSADEVPLLSAIETLLRRLLVREVATGYIPTHTVPLTQLMTARPKKPKKPKKPMDMKPLAQIDDPPGAVEQKGGHRKPRKVDKPPEDNNPRGKRGGRNSIRDTATPTTARRGTSRKNNPAKKR